MTNLLSREIERSKRQSSWRNQTLNCLLFEFDSDASQARENDGSNLRFCESQEDAVEGFVGMMGRGKRVNAHGHVSRRLTRSR